ncbi:MAG TPA: sigma factor [Candidatus Dormibacteraeota bacterium]|jgi:DNA-directed RNA polymerase sigma subunit (sigma70/sigma32)|nr:sigma factor [Candidatus Dormibacteraeota bacterium]
MGVNGNHHDRATRAEIVDSDAETVRDLLRQAAATKPLTDGEQQRLLERAGFGDKASQERLVAANLGMVIRLADQRAEQGLSRPDLVQEGSIGLVEAVRSFAASAESDFVRFAERSVGAQMDAALAAEAAAVRDAELLVTAATDYERTEVIMRRELKRDASVYELAEKLEWTVERTRYVAQVVADARRRHDEELLEFIDPAAIDFDDDERVEFGS